MEEFERWAETQKGLIKYDEITSKAAKLAWKAALEWILYAGVLTDLPKDLIEKELGITK